VGIKCGAFTGEAKLTVDT